MPATPASPSSVDVRAPPRVTLGLEIGLITLAILLVVAIAVFLALYLRRKRPNTDPSTRRSFFSNLKSSSPSSTLPHTPDSAYSLAGGGQTPRYSMYFPYPPL